MGIDELGQLGCAGSCEGDDTGAVLFEERFDGGETNASGVWSAQARYKVMMGTTWMRR